MVAILNDSIKQLISYLSSVLAEGLDISALYIIEAHLTKIKTLLQPASLMLQLFSNIQIKKIITFSREYYQKQKSKESSLSSLDNINNGECHTFKLSLKDFDSNPVSQIGIVAEQILQTLEEWDQISQKTQALKVKLGTVTDYSCCLSEYQNLKQQLQILIRIMSNTSMDSQIKIITDSNSCFSSCQDIQVLSSNKRLKIYQITSLFQYLIIWSGQIMKQISDFSSLINVIRLQFSIDKYQRFKQPKLAAYRTSIQQKLHHPQRSSGKGNNRTQKILTKKQNKDTNVGQFDNQFPSIKRVNSSCRSFSSFDSQTPFTKIKTTKIESSIDVRRKDVGRNKENSLPLKQKQCQKCQIY